MSRRKDLPDFVALDFQALKQWGSLHPVRVYASCLVRAGWTHRSVSRAAGYYPNWSNDNHIAEDYVESSLRDYRLITGLGLTVPDVPVKVEPVKRSRVRARSADPDTIRRLKELHAIAKNYRGTPKNREAAQLFTQMLWRAMQDQGATTYGLAKDLGISHSALQFRLVRYGYKESTGRSGAYRRLTGRPVGAGTRKGHPQTHCKRGHELTDDNVLFNGFGPNGEHNRVCRKCRRAKSREYYQRKKAAQAAQ
jgi:hypothetical protein